MSLFHSFGRRPATFTRVVGADGYRIGFTKPTLAARKTKRRHTNQIAKASRRRNRP